MASDYSKYFSIKDYYTRVVMPLNKRFRVTRGDKFICPLHGDTDPSMGIVYSKSKGEIYHCFGCNSWGTVLDLHRKISFKYFNKNLDEEEALKDLCRVMGGDFKAISREMSIDTDSAESKEIQRQVSMREALSRFDVSDFNRMLIDGKIAGKGVPYFNTIMVMMIDADRVRRESR